MNERAESTRRQFLQGAALGTACAVGMGIVGSTDAALAEEITWDAEYDVVVVGMGFAGSVAAVSAADEGASVLLVDKAPEGSTGGNSRVSGQYIQATDDPDAMYTYLSALMGDFPNWDPDVLRAHVDGTAEQYDWLVHTMGADPDVLIQDESWDTTYSKGYKTDKFAKEGYVQQWSEFPEYEGAEHCLSFLVTGKGFDSAFYELCKENIAKRDIDVWYESAGKHLIMGADGEVLGVQVEQPDGVKNVKAAGGVVLACGGYENNQQMMADFMQQPENYTFGCVYNTGDGIVMGQEAGASFWHLSNGAAFMWGYIPEGSSACAWPPVSTSKGIFVGPSGSRYVNEQAESRHGRISIGGAYLIRQTPRPTWYVMDSDLAAQYKFHPSFSDGNVDEIASGIVLQGETLADLAQAMGVDADNLQKTVKRYNEDYAAGRDADFGRPFETIFGPIEQGPFYALKLVPVLLNTQGGPRRNALAQVVNPDLEPIEGLFSAGELGALWPDNYNGGGNIGECCTFGRLAGKNAAKRAQGTL